MPHRRCVYLSTCPKKCTGQLHSTVLELVNCVQQPTNRKSALRATQLMQAGPKPNQADPSMPRQPKPTFGQAAMTATSTIMVTAAEKNSMPSTSAITGPKLLAAAIERRSTEDAAKRSSSTALCALSLSATPDHRLPAGPPRK